jgi:hypothetical protein
MAATFGRKLHRKWGMWETRGSAAVLERKAAIARKELVEISDFLRAHGYQVSNPQHWGFLGQAVAK